MISKSLTVALLFGLLVPLESISPISSRVVMSAIDFTFLRSILRV